MSSFSLYGISFIALLLGHYYYYQKAQEIPLYPIFRASDASMHISKDFGGSRMQSNLQDTKTVYKKFLKIIHNFVLLPYCILKSTYLYS